MSYARVGTDSDVYVYHSADSLYCVVSGTVLKKTVLGFEKHMYAGMSYTFMSRLEAIDGLVALRVSGVRIPDDVFKRLVGEFLDKGDDFS